MQQLEYDEGFSFLRPWSKVGEYARNLETELRKEIAAGHPLYSLKARAIAQRIDNDDVLFEVDCSDFRYAVVHLTWTNDAEHAPQWPSAEIFPTFKSWAEHRMKRDNEQFFPGENR